MTIRIHSFREYIPEVFIREYVSEVHGVPQKLCSRGVWFNFDNQVVIEVLKISVISRCKFFLSMSHTRFCCNHFFEYKSKILKSCNLFFDQI